MTHPTHQMVFRPLLLACTPMGWSVKIRLTSRAAFYWKNMLNVKGQFDASMSNDRWVTYIYYICIYIYYIYICIYIYRVIHIQRCFANSHFFIIYIYIYIFICGEEITSRRNHWNWGAECCARPEKGQ